MADDPRPDDDATRIYRPYGSPPPAPDEPDPFAPDPFAPDPFAPDPSAPDPSAADPFAPDPSAPEAPTAAPDPFAPGPPASGPPPAPAPRHPAPPAHDPFAPDLLPPVSDPFAPVAPAAPAPDPFAPAASDPFASAGTPAPAATSPASGTPPADPFAPDPFTPTAPDPFTPSAPDPFRAASPPPSAPDPFAPSGGDAFGTEPSTPSPASSTPPPAGPAPSPPAPDPFSVTPADPFAPPPPVPAPAPAPRAPDPFTVQPLGDSSDPFATLKGGPGSGGAFDSAVRHDRYQGGTGVDLPDAFGTERTLAGAFSAVFSLILQIRAADRLGDATALRQRIEALLGEAARSARTVGASDADVDEATFAAIAFLDEAVLGTEWPGRDGWSAQPLQLAHYDRYDAGEQFFDRLKRLLDEGGTRTAVLEVYYLCLALGFKGRYAIQGREVLRRLVEDLHGRLERANGAAGVLSPRGRSREVPAQAEAGGVPTWALWLGAAVLVALLYIGLSVSLSGGARETADVLRSLSATTE